VNTGLCQAEAFPPAALHRFSLDVPTVFMRSFAFNSRNFKTVLTSCVGTVLFCLPHDRKETLSFEPAMARHP
jgi:hypothetical protein